MQLSLKSYATVRTFNYLFIIVSFWFFFWFRFCFWLYTISIFGLDCVEWIHIYFRNKTLFYWGVNFPIKIRMCHCLSACQFSLTNQHRPPNSLKTVDEHAVNKSEDMVADARNFAKAELDKSQSEAKMSREIKVPHRACLLVLYCWAKTMRAWHLATHRPTPHMAEAIRGQIWTNLALRCRTGIPSVCFLRKQTHDFLPHR